jgi:hypothetical protein
MLTLYTSVSILEEVDRRRDKTSRSEFSSVILEAGLSDEEKITIMASVALSGTRLPTRNPQAASKDIPPIQKGGCVT